MTNLCGCGNIIRYRKCARSSVDRVPGYEPVGRGFESPRARQQKTHFCLPTKVRFLNDVCLRQMMTASPNDVRCANDVWLRHVLWQTSHHYGTKWRNIIFAKQMQYISAGDASLKYAETKVEYFYLLLLQFCSLWFLFN